MGYENGRVVRITGANDQPILQTSRAGNAVTLRGASERSRSRVRLPRKPAAPSVAFTIRRKKREWMIEPDGDEHNENDHRIPSVRKPRLPLADENRALLTDGDFTYEQKPTDVGEAAL